MVSSNLKHYNRGIASSPGLSKLSHDSILGTEVARIETLDVKYNLFTMNKTMALLLVATLTELPYHGAQNHNTARFTQGVYSMMMVMLE